MSFVKLRVLRVFVAVLLSGAVAIVTAQDSFEVASVKANKSGETNGMLGMLPGGRVRAQNMPVRQIIIYSYQLAPFQLVGGAGWLQSDRYDIIAKIEGNPAPIPPGSGHPDAQQLAMRNLLADRFKMKAHRETREMDIYALVLVKPGTPGPSLKPSPQDCAAQAAARRGQPPQPPGPPGSALTAPGPFCGIAGGPGRIRFGGLNSSMLAQAFSGQAGRIVVDRTGLPGSWDFELNYAIEGRGGDIPAPDQNAPNFFTAIQEQLGLKLESTKGPVEVLVIDAIERPTDD